ncbi:hypothetical protein N665_1518s0007 [Sinapis alba]|nr:hypothetical protein N665_1518s0007 [Sinapis alba]
MRSASIFLVSCILMSFVLNNIKDVEAGLTPMDNQCGQKDIFTCINDFVKKGGAGNTPSSCECDNFGDEHLCRCNLPC